MICVTLAQLKLFLPRRPRRSRRCDGHVIPNALTHFTDQLYDRFDIKPEHLVFEHLGQPDLSTFFIGGRVVSKKIGRDLPSGVLGFALPLPSKATNEDPVGQRAARSERQIAIGITIDEMQGFFGPPKHLVDYTFKGRPASYRIYQTDEGSAFASFTFVDGVLIEFGGGGRTPLSKILNGG